MRICVFGDSITAGFFDSQGGWVPRLAGEANKKIVSSDFTYRTSIYNLGISGDNTYSLLERFDAETASRVAADEELAILFSIGVNDSIFVYSKNEPQVPVGYFQENLKKLIEKAKKFTGRIAFTGLLPADETLLDPIPWHREGAYKSELIKQYEAAIKEVCDRERISFIPLLEPFSKGDWKILLVDGVHPSDEGHDLISEIVVEELRKINWL